MQFICATDKYCSLKEHVPAPIFRRTFDVFGEVKRATLDITVTGFYQLYVNGVDITKGLLAPYISNPDHVLYLDSYDIAPYLSEGKNAIAVILGNGFDCAGLFGSQNNDAIILDGDKIKTRTNNCGGILGGMTNGMPLVFRAAMKPTPSIYKEQDSVDTVSMTPVKLSIKGRHDPCIVLRAAPVVEAVTAIAICDALADREELQ